MNAYGSQQSGGLCASEARTLVNLSHRSVSGNTVDLLTGPLGPIVLVT